MNRIWVFEQYHVDWVMHISFIIAEIAMNSEVTPLQSEWVIDSTDEEHQGGGVGCIIL